jgi:hypothetical protein
MSERALAMALIRALTPAPMTSEAQQHAAYDKLVDQLREREIPLSPNAALLLAQDALAEVGVILPRGFLMERVR